MKEDPRWPTRFDLSLDNRQIFLLFFASAVVLGLVFALGLVVGKRMDREPARAATTDPLALLDQLGGEGGEETLTFHDRLTKAQGPAESPALPDARNVAPRAEPSSPARPELPRPEAPRPEVPRPDLPRSPEKPRSALAAAPAAVPSAAQETGKKPVAKPPKAAAAGEQDGAAEESYTLQLSSFQERREAELFMEKLRQTGLKPYLVPTTIPGRGVWFRVRLGRFKSWEAALSAKQTFERTQKIIAYVSKT